MSIGFDQNTAEGPKSKFIQVSPETAIADGRFVVGLEVGEGDYGYGNIAWLQCDVEDTTGAKASARWFEPVMGGSWIKTEADLKKAQNSLVSLVANLVRRYKGEDYVMTGAATFKEFFEKAVRAIQSTPNWDKKELRIVVINGRPTDDGAKFPTLPRYAPVFADKGDTTKLSLTKKDGSMKYDVEAWVAPAVTPDDDITIGGDTESTVDF